MCFPQAAAKLSKEPFFLVEEPEIYRGGGVSVIQLSLLLVVESIIWTMHDLIIRFLPGL